MSPASATAIQEFAAATLEVLAARRSEPTDDLLSVWSRQQVEYPDGTVRLMDDGEVIQEALLLLDGGAETTRTVIGTMCLELTRHEDQWQQLRDDPGILGRTGVEEFIRWVTPILNMKRTATEDHEFHGQQVHKDDELVLMYSSANRDERVFPDPDVFDVNREHNHHVAFGFGSHFCLGASLARLEIRVMFEELLTRMPNWRLVPGADPKKVPSAFACAYDAIPIEIV
jgi:cytochrome P450 family 142 subfamily A polypeptide 1